MPAHSFMTILSLQAKHMVAPCAMGALVCLSLSSLADEDLNSSRKAALLFSNGDKLTGSPQFNNGENELNLQSDYLEQAAKIPLSNLLSIEFEDMASAQNAEIFTRVALHHRNQETSGDVLTGQVKELTSDNIILDTWYGGTLTLKRSMVQSLDIISLSAGQYRGPSSLNEWHTSSEGELRSWRFNGNELICPGIATESIGKDIGLRKKSQISFDVVAQQRLNFQLQLYANNIEKLKPSAYYQFQFDNYRATFTTRTSGRDGRAMSQRLNINTTKKNYHFDIYIDRESGITAIHIDGERKCIMQSNNPNPDDLGTGIRFVANPVNPISISNITVYPWSGIPPEQDVAQASTKPEQAPEDPHNIILLNGDKIPCKVGIIKDDRMIVDTKHTPIRIPINKIRSISLGDKREEPKKYKGDIRAWFKNGGYVTLRLSSLSAERINGYSQATGDVSMKLSAFSRIDFNIYGVDANKRREKYFSR